jgi:hypothetical protein
MSSDFYNEKYICIKEFDSYPAIKCYPLKIYHVNTTDHPNEYIAMDFAEISIHKFLSPELHPFLVDPEIFHEHFRKIK